MKTIQTNEEILANAKAFLRYTEPTKFLLIADPRTMTADQFRVAESNAVLMNHWLAKNKNTEQGID